MNNPKRQRDERLPRADAKKMKYRLPLQRSPINTKCGGPIAVEQQSAVRQRFQHREKDKNNQKKTYKSHADHAVGGTGDRNAQDEVVRVEDHGASGALYISKSS